MMSSMSDQLEADRKKLMINEAVSDVFQRQQFITREVEMDLNGSIARFVLKKCGIKDEEKEDWWEKEGRKDVRAGHMKKRNTIQTTIKTHMKSKRPIVGCVFGRYR